MKLSIEEFCRRVGEATVASTSVSMVMKAGSPEYRVRYTLAIGEERLEKRTVWNTSGGREELERALVTLAAGEAARTPKGGRQRVARRAKEIHTRLRRAVIGFAARSSTREKIAETERSRLRRQATEKLVECIRELLRVHPQANRGDMMKAYEAAKNRETVRTVMEK